MHIDQARRDYLIDKYGMNEPPQIDNYIDRAIQRVERTMSRAVGLRGDTSPLFDPDWNHDMWELDNETMEVIRKKFGDFIAGVSDGSVFCTLRASLSFVRTAATLSGLRTC